MRTTTFAILPILALASTACVTDPDTGEQRLSRAAIGGAIGAGGGYILGDILGGRRDRGAKLIGAGVGGLAGVGIGAYMDEQERRLRQQTAGTDVEIIRQGDELRLNLPSGVTFASNSYTIQPQFERTLDEVAGTLSQYEKTFIDVYGHTDSTGGDAINVPLSQNRAQAVASYLARRGVNPARIETRGFAATQPVASNDTADGRQANRRVEIKIVPVTENDLRG